MGNREVKREEGDGVVWMETAPWRANKRARVQQRSADVTPTVTESLRIPPTQPPRVERREAAQLPDPMDVALADETELQEQEEDDVPANPGRGECQAIWASLLDVQDEDQVREGLEQASSSSSRPDMQLAPRHVERVKRIIHGMTTEGIIRVSLNLPHVLSSIQAAINEIIQDALDTRKQKQVESLNLNQEEGDIGGEDPEEEVRVEDEDCVEEMEENMLMQHDKHLAGRASQDEAKGTTPPLLAEDRERLVALVRRDTLSEQINAEPALTLLALLGEEPANVAPGNCSESEGEGLATLPELRPAIRRWYSATPQKLRPREWRPSFLGCEEGRPCKTKEPCRGLPGKCNERPRRSPLS